MFFSIQLFNHLLYLDRKEKRVIDAIKIVKQFYLQQVFIDLQFFLQLKTAFFRIFHEE